MMASLPYDLATALAEHHDVTVLAPHPSRPAGYDFSNCPPVKGKFNLIRVKTSIYTASRIVGRSKEGISLGKSVARFIQNHHDEYDVLYMMVSPYFAEYYITKAAVKYHLPLVRHIQDVFPEPIVRRIPVFGKLVFKLALPIDKFICRHSTRIICIGDRIKNYVSRTRKTDEKKMYVVMNWQDESRFKEHIPYDTSRSVFTYMFLGNLSSAANLHYLLRCYAESGAKDTRLVIAGTGNIKDSLIELAGGYPNAQIVFRDAPSAEVNKIQSEADVLLLPLRKSIALRCNPSKLPAYMFSHRAILACVESGSDVDCTIKAADCGWVVEPDDDSALKKMFKELPSVSQEELERKGENGYMYSQLHLTKNVNLQCLMDVITGINRE
ncbi:MAG: glycosyltransferase family 4 protein [Bacteroidales bacterium]|nr:glycosyltransferase family 4 protein [Bacteroidales bacterium]